MTLTAFELHVASIVSGVPLGLTFGAGEECSVLLLNVLKEQQLGYHDNILIQN